MLIFCTSFLIEGLSNLKEAVSFLSFFFFFEQNCFISLISYVCFVTKCDVFIYFCYVQHQIGGFDWSWD
jgi:hypothetical protein